jgi:hypothetical protein
VVKEVNLIAAGPDSLFVRHPQDGAHEDVTRPA